MGVRFDGLDGDESVVCWMPMSFAGSAATSIRGAVPLASLGGTRRDRGGPTSGLHVPRTPHSRGRAIRAWADVAESCGFPIVGGDMIVGLSDRRRIHVWKPSFWLPRPGRHGGWFPCARVVQVGVTKNLATGRMTMLIDDGTMLGFESMKRRRIDNFAARLRDSLAR